MRNTLATTIVLSVAVALAAFQPVRAGAAETLGSYRIDPGAISISGISSGAYMAGQFHAAHSATIMGVGLIAGGPYLCAEVNPGFGEYLGSYKELWNAIFVCSHQASQIPLIGSFLPFLGPPGAGKSVAAIRAKAMNGAIDPLENMRDDRVWLFSGTRDTLVPRSVMDAVHTYYATILGALGQAAAANITYVGDIDVHHAMVVAEHGDNNCLEFALPYINDCDYDAAGNMLASFYGRPGAPLRPPEPWDRHSLIAFDQTEIFPEGTGRGEGGDGAISMNDIGHVYVPGRCRDGATCRLHIALHGCEQYQQRVKAECGLGGGCRPRFFFEAAGYNRWAEANDIIVLYPQTTAWDGPSPTRTNPKGCWDWWGYGGGDYATKDGKQIRAIKAMIDRLTGG